MSTDFYRRLDRVDNILDRGPSDASAGADIISLIQDPDVGQYFFKEASSPGWLDILPDSLFVTYEAGGGWVGGRYMERVAWDRPGDVVRLCRLAFDKRGGKILGGVLRIAEELPPERAIDLVGPIVEWLEKSRVEVLAHEATSLSRSLLEGDRAEEALEILEVLIDLVEPDRSNSAVAHGLPQPKIRPWQYEEMLSEEMELAFQLSPRAAWSLAFESMVEGMQRGASSSDRSPGSGYWRAAIEEHAQNEPGNHIDALLDYVRDKAEALIESDIVTLADVIGRIRRRSEIIFKRLELYLCRRFREDAGEYIEENLTDKSLFESTEVHHEYFHLLHCCLDVLAESDQEQILQWIDDQQETVAEIQGELEQLAGEVTDGEVQEALEIRRLRRLSPVAPHLEGERRAEFEQLVSQHEEPEHPDFLVYHYPVQHGPESPHEREELEDASAQEIVERLPVLFEERDDEPALVAPSEGISRQLASVVSSRPAEFADVAPEFMRGGAVGVRALLSGLRTALDAEEEFSWQPPLTLCAQTLEQGFLYTAVDTDSEDQEARDWARARRLVADLLAKGLEDVGSSLDIEHRRTVWELLAELVGDPDPDPAEVRSSDLDPATESLNTTRGKAMHAVFRYIFWVKRSLEPEQSGDDFEFDMRLVEEVQQVLDRHLNLSEDASLAIRAIYGQWFPSMVSLDSRWAETHVSDVFPADRKRHSHWAAAWVTYLTFWQPYRGVFRILRSEYQRALDRFDALASGEDDGHGLRDPVEQLGQHLAILYWQGVLEEFGESELLNIFFSYANPEQRVKVLEFVGRSLRSSGEDDISGEILRRLQVFWTERLDQVDDDQEIRLELHGFVSWFESAVFDPAWSLRQLYDTLKLCKTLPQHPSAAIIRLGEIAEADPEMALECLILLGSENFGMASLRVHNDAAKIILREALNCGDAAVREKALSFIDGLGRRGLVDEFRELVDD